MRYIIQVEGGGKEVSILAKCDDLTYAKVGRSWEKEQVIEMVRLANAADERNL